MNVLVWYVVQEGIFFGNYFFGYMVVNISCCYY